MGELGEVEVEARVERVVSRVLAPVGWVVKVRLLQGWTPTVQ